MYVEVSSWWTDVVERGPPNPLSCVPPQFPESTLAPVDFSSQETFGSSRPKRLREVLAIFSGLPGAQVGPGPGPTLSSGSTLPAGL